MLAEYLKRTRADQSATATLEEIPEDSDSDFLRRKERLMLGLRLSSGVPSSSFEEIRKTLPVASARQIENAFLAGLLEEFFPAPASAGATGAPPRVHLTRKGVLLSNEVFSALV